MADWALNLDGAVVDVDERARPTGSPMRIITGYHEDFSPVWSPDGRWVAYHSHRTRTPVATYLADASDDIWLRHAGAPRVDSTERRLTDFGWEAGSPDWSPDGTRMVFTSWVKGGAPDASFAWTVTIDPRQAGRGHGRLPLPAPIHGAELAAWSPTGGEIAIEEKLDERGTPSGWSAPTARGRGKWWNTPCQPMAASTGCRMGDRSCTRPSQAIACSCYGVRRRRHPATAHEDSANLLHPQVSPDGRFIAATRILQKRAVWSLELPR